MRKTCSCLFVALVVALAGCQSVAYGPATPEGQRNAFMDAYTSWKAGITTFEDMKKKYGEPTNTAQTENGFAARWVRTSRVITQADAGARTPGARFSSETSRPTFTSTVKAAMEAFFDKNNKLTSFRIQLLD